MKRFRGGFRSLEFRRFRVCAPAPGDLEFLGALCSIPRALLLVICQGSRMGDLSSGNTALVVGIGSLVGIL